MSVSDIPSINELEKSVLNNNEPIGKRTRCIFYLKHYNNIEAIKILAKVMRDESVLLAHEAAYALGQTENNDAVPFLEEILKDKTCDPIVRHESAEALAAIGLESSLNLLKEYCHDECIEVAETCVIAVDNLEWKIKNKNKNLKSQIYRSVDPAPPIENDDMDTNELRNILCDTSLSLFERYRAMFSLRNRGDDECVAALGEGLNDKSPVFSHECAYVLGQMASPAAIHALSNALKDNKMHAMVRHEAAEALGAIGTEEVEKLLSSYQKDKETIVKESCDVALDIAAYWASNDI